MALSVTSTQDISSRVIARLRELRKIQGKSAQDIANITGIPRTTIANMETGRRATLSLDDAFSISAALNVDLRLILSDEPMPVAREVWVI